MADKLNPELRVFETAELAARGVAGEFCLLRGDRPFTVALSGGDTPRLLFRLLAEEFRDRVQWKNARFFWSDERCVLHEDPSSNFRLAQETLFGPLKIPPENIFAVPTAARSPQDAAEEYEAELGRFFGLRTGGGEVPVFDLVLLGTGRDGHTASLFPGHLALEERKRWVCAVQTDAASPPWRVTLTLPVLNRARRAVFLVTGGEKREAVRAVFGAPGGAPAKPLPAALVRGAGPGRVTWFVDRAAAP